MTKRRPLALGAAATIGFGSLFLASPALATEEAPAPAESFALATSSDIALAAAQNDMQVHEVEQLVESDALVVTEGGASYYKDPAHVAEGHELHGSDAAKIPGSPAEGSRPGAPVTIFLDFGGETLQNTLWNDRPGTDDGSPIETLNFAPATGVDEAQIWASVAEDYAPFNVNVTTTDPGADALYKTSADDATYGSHVIITDSYTDVLPAAEGSGGIAWLGGAGSEWMTGALVFTQGTGSTKSAAEAASHEAGHNFGLDHDGIGAEEYYAPVDGLWGPIMGAGYDVPVTQWSNGDYAGASNDQDDLAVISDRGAAGERLAYLSYENGTRYPATEAYCTNGGENPQPGDLFVASDGVECLVDVPLTPTWTLVDRADRIADDHGNDAASATALDNADGTFEAAGVIGATGDVDAFRLTTEGGEVTATVEVADIAANLNAKLTLLDANGNVVKENAGDPQRVDGANASGLGASITADNVAAGTYTLTVEGAAFGDGSGATSENAGGFSNYGSLGNYTLSGTAEPAEIVVDAPAITSPVDGSTVEGPVTAISGTGLAGATVNVTGDVEGSATVSAEGTWAVEANLGAGEYSVSATQTSQNVTSASTTSAFTVTEKPQPPMAPTITSITDGQAFGAGEGPSGVSGTGIAGAEVTVTLGGKFFTATVGADGTWAVDFGGALPAGSYELSATQNVNGLDSAADTVTFSVAADGGNAGANGGNAGANGGNAGANGGSADANGAGGDDLANTGGFSMLPFGLTAAAMLLLGLAVTALVARRQKSTEA